MEIRAANTTANHWLDKLRDTNHLRWTIAGMALGIGYLGIHWPCNEYSHTLTRQIANEKRKEMVAREVLALRKELRVFESHVPERHADATAWRQSILGALGKTALVLVSLEPDKGQRLGPYELEILRLELQGTYDELERFLEWIEKNPSLRVNTLVVSPERSAGTGLQFQLAIAGLLG